MLINNNNSWCANNRAQTFTWGMMQGKEEEIREQSGRLQEIIFTSGRVVILWSLHVSLTERVVKRVADKLPFHSGNTNGFRFTSWNFSKVASDVIAIICQCTRQRHRRISAVHIGINHQLGNNSSINNVRLFTRNWDVIELTKINRLNFERVKTLRK